MNLATGTQTIGPDTIRADAEALLAQSDRAEIIVKCEHVKVFQEILENIKSVNFRELADLAADQRLNQNHYRVLTVKKVLEVALDLNCGLCRNQDFVYAYNGEYWQLIGREELEYFLGEAAEKLGVDYFLARDYEFKGKLYKQFLADAYLPKPKNDPGTVLINMLNGTLVIDGVNILLRKFDRRDFLTHQLSFNYDVSADCPKWMAFLDEVLPETDITGREVDYGRSRQMVLAEYFGYVFARNLKLEKTLLLFGSGGER